MPRARVFFRLGVHHYPQGYAVPEVYGQSRPLWNMELFQFVERLQYLKRTSNLRLVVLQCFKHQLKRSELRILGIDIDHAHLSPVLRDDLRLVLPCLPFLLLAHQQSDALAVVVNYLLEVAKEASQVQPQRVKRIESQQTRTKLKFSLWHYKQDSGFRF